MTEVIIHERKITEILKEKENNVTSTLVFLPGICILTELAKNCS